MPAYDGTTAPTKTQVEEMINRNEDRIDTRTGHAWRSKTVTDEYYDVTNRVYRYNQGYPIFLKHREVTTFESGTDKLEVWDGSQWLDFVASASHTEDRSQQYWVNYNLGIVYIREFTWRPPWHIRVTYRYGASSVNLGIEDLCVKMTARDLLMQEDYAMDIPEGTTHLSVGEKINNLNDEIEKTFQSYVEPMVI